MQYGRKCLLCKNTRQRERGCRLFKFPTRGSSMWFRWLEACGLQEADIDESSREPPRLCQRHFQKKDFLTRQLTGTAVPTIFPLAVYTEIDCKPISERNADETVEELSQSNVELQEQVMDEMYQLSEVAFSEEDNLNGLIECTESGQCTFEDGSSDSDIGKLPSAGTIEDSKIDCNAVVEYTGERILKSDSCGLKEHAELLEKLHNEQDKVELLTRELAEKDKIIEEQYEILKQLGVQFVTFSEG